MVVGAAVFEFGDRRLVVAGRRSAVGGVVSVVVRQSRSRTLRFQVGHRPQGLRNSTHGGYARRMHADQKMAKGEGKPTPKIFNDPEVSSTGASSTAFGFRRPATGDHSRSVVGGWWAGEDRGGWCSVVLGGLWSALGGLSVGGRSAVGKCIEWDEKVTAKGPRSNRSRGD
jgi:hypothetical protein